MTENTETTEATAPASIDVDFDAWLAGGERKTHLVTLHGRADLFADIEALQRQRVDVPEVHEDDRALGGDDDPNAELDAQIEALWEKLDASKREFRVSARTDDELDVILAQTKADLKDETDAAATKARAEARTMAKQLGITVANDINRMVASAAAEAVDKIIERESDIRTIAASTTMRSGDTWVPATADRLRTLRAKLGEAQFNLLKQAYSRAATETPAVTVPK